MKKQALLIATISILAMLAFLSHILVQWPYLKDHLSEEWLPLLGNALVLLPAIIGLWKFTHRPLRRGVIIGFVLYGLLVVGGYLQVYLADDPLAAGLPMVLLVIPFSLLFSLYLVKLKK